MGRLRRSPCQLIPDTIISVFRERQKWRDIAKSLRKEGLERACAAQFDHAVSCAGAADSIINDACFYLSLTAAAKQPPRLY